MSRAKVYILDTHTLSPLGLGTEALLASLQNQHQATAPISQFDAAGLSQTHACEVAQAHLAQLQELSEAWQVVAEIGRAHV